MIIVTTKIKESEKIIQCHIFSCITALAQGRKMKAISLPRFDNKLSHSENTVIFIATIFR
jgi:hypothetical protein